MVPWIPQACCRRLCSYLKRTKELSDAGGPRRLSRHDAWPARHSLSDLVSSCPHAGAKLTSIYNASKQTESSATPARVDEMR